MRTEFEQKNSKFSDKAHIAAQTQLYPKLFNVTPDKIVYEDVTLSEDPRHKILDAEMAVDRVLSISMGTLRFPITYTVQERFRRPQYKKYQDITITECNLNSGVKSELYKLSGGLFVYGYFNENTNMIEQFIVLCSSELLYKIVRGDLKKWSVETNRKNQTFITIKFDILRNNKLILYEYIA